MSDATHHAGTPGFFFLPPLAPPARYGPTPSRGLSPVVTVDELGGRGTIARFTTTATVTDNRVWQAREFYTALWITKDAALDPKYFYRIRVSVGGFELGFADVQMVRTAKEVIQGLINLKTREVVPLLANSALPIIFRIEPQALRCVGVACSAQDPCHPAGVCVPQTGECTHPVTCAAVLPDSERSASAMIDPAQGGTIALVDSRGTNYSLEIPPRAIVGNAPIQIRVTPIASAAGLPASFRPIGGVLYEPEGLNLYRDANLTLTWNTPVATDQVVATQFSGSGLSMRLAPVLFPRGMGTTTSATVRVNHFSGTLVGTGSPLEIGNGAPAGTAEAYIGTIAGLIPGWVQGDPAAVAEVLAQFKG